MKKKSSLLFIITILVLQLYGCSDPTSSGSVNISGSWLIPSNEIRDGGPGRDGIPALSNPELLDVISASFLQDNDLVVGIKVGNESRAYPHKILDWHEIINEDINGELIAVTYCPLTGSAIGWDRRVGGRTTTFGVSGLLYNTNLIPYDRATQSNWSQMELLCVNGSLQGEVPKIHQVIETTWATWKEMAPETQVVSRNTGFNSPYGDYPYGDYRTNQSRLIFPVNNTDGRLPGKSRVLGIIVNDQTKAFPINRFSGSLEVMSDTFNGVPMVIAGSSLKNFAVAYERTLEDNTVLTFKAKNGVFPTILVDNEGNEWDVFGTAVSGKRAGTQLKPTLAYIAYWFAWAAFHPGTDIRN